MAPGAGRSADDGLADWQQRVSAAYFPLVTEGRRGKNFRGRLDIWQLGLVSATRIDCDAVLYRRTPRHLREERESAFLISIPGSAEVTFHQSARQAQCRPGGFVIERSDAPYEYWHDTPDVQWVAKIPRDSVRARIGSFEKFLGLSMDARSGIASYFLSSLSSAVTHADAMDESARALAGEHLIEVLCLALLAGERALDSSESAVRRAHLHRAETFIRKSLKNPGLSAGTVAEACGISMRYLQQLFEGTGFTASGYIRECRLVRSDEDLRRGADTITAIAYRWGFSDQAQFSRHYRARFGLTPSEARHGVAASSISQLMK